MPSYFPAVEEFFHPRQQRSIAPLDVTRYDWGRRMFEPNAPLIFNKDGTVSTHRMAAEVDERGNWFAFPTIIRDQGKLRQLPVKEAFKWNLQKGEAVPFGQDKDTALFFAAGGYKQGSPLNY